MTDYLDVDHEILLLWNIFSTYNFEAYLSIWFVSILRFLAGCKEWCGR